MSYIFMIAIITTALFLLFYHKACIYDMQAGMKLKKGQKADERTYLIILLCVAFVFRMILVNSYAEKGDMSAFSGWGQEVWENGFASFYANHGATTYPPLYILVLTIIAAIRSLFHIASLSTADFVLLKLPAILFDMATAVFVYHLARKKFTHVTSILLMMTYIFNPAVIINSTIWGQVDSLYIFFVVLTCYLIAEHKLKWSYFTFAIAFLLKTQTIIFTPVLIYGTIDQVFLENFNWKKFRTNLFMGLGAIALIAAVYLPFLLGDSSGAKEMAGDMSDTLGAFPYASVNAHNFWTMCGLNWASQSTKFLFFSCKTWGYLAIAGLLLGSFMISHRCKKDPAKYPLIGAFIMSTMFLFSVRMHERYLFPVLLLLLLAFLLKPNKETFYSYTFFTAFHFLNVAYVLFIYDANQWNARYMIPMFIALGTLLSWIYLMKTIQKHYKCEQIYEIKRDAEYVKQQEKTKIPLKSKKKKKDKKEFHFQRSQSRHPFQKKDGIIMLAITFLYAVIACYDLGSTNVPKTGYTLEEENRSILLDFGEEKEFGALYYYLGDKNNCQFTIQTATDWEASSGSLTGGTSKELEMAYVFCWGAASAEKPSSGEWMEWSGTGRYLQITANTLPASILELVIKDTSGKILQPVNAEQYKNLFDEAATLGEGRNFRNGTIFDEVFHARTAYEYLHGLPTYETSHPPLGKVLISIGIAIFGMNPFGWRIIGTLFGIAMLPFIYRFAHQFFKKTWIAAMVCTLFAADFMHFTQTRISTIDVYITFFVIAMYYFMYKYCTMTFYDTPLRKTFLPLGLCGISMGLGVASKWTGVYAGLGLAVIFFAHLLRRYREYLYAKEAPDKETDGISHRIVIAEFKKKTIATLAFCLVFFVLVPIIIYLLSYIPFIRTGSDGFIDKVIANQKFMFTYHSGLKETHPYSSHWYEWPMIVMPAMYYQAGIGEEMVGGIAAMGNPLVWWIGLVACFYLIKTAVWEKDRKAGFLLIGYAAQYLPWVFVSRYTFIYHYFPSTPFLVLMIGYSMYTLYQKKESEKEKKTFLIKMAIYVSAAVLLFVFFYPALSGQMVPNNFAVKAYRWFARWYLL